MLIIKHSILFVFTLLIVFVSSAQTEAEMKAKADAFFVNNQFVEATPLYLRLLSLQPRDYEYSYKYGACLLYNSNNKQDALRYLTYAVKNPVNTAEPHYFLGKAYHLNYQFNEAITEYKSYLQLAGTKATYSKDAQRNIEMCANGKQLISTITDIVVKKKTEINQNDFFRLYDLSDIGGTLITATNFQTKNDKKFNHTPVICILPNMENVYFASYGEGDNLDIYVARKLPGGKFGLPQKLNNEVNTPYDENFPFMHPNGRDLYFSSKGHNSMGGYDIFKARYDADNNSYSNVANIDFAISSPDDDMLYIVDNDYKNAYFSSTRQSKDGNIVVYKVGVDRIPIQIAIVKGAFQSSVLPDNPQMTCVVTDKGSGKQIGVFKSQEKNSYLIVFPKGGKYNYKITVNGSNEEFNLEVDIPFLKELRPLKQKMEHLVVNGQEQIKIINLFDEQIEDAQSIVSQVLKERANLNVNEDQFNQEELNAQLDLQRKIGEIGLGNRTPNEVAQLLDSKINDASNSNQADKKIETATNGVVAQLYAQIEQTDATIKRQIIEADNADNVQRKTAILENVQEAFEQRDQLLEKIEETQKVSAQLGNQSISGDRINVKQLQQVNEQYKAALAQNNLKDASKILSDNKDFLLSTVRTNNSSITEELAQQQMALDEKLKQLNALEASTAENIAVIEKSISDLTAQKDAAKEKQKAPIQDEIDAKTFELNDAKSSLEKIRTQIGEKKEEKTKHEQVIGIASEITSYNGKEVSKEEIAQAKTNANNSKINTLRSYAENSLAELKNNKTTITKTFADNAIEQYNAQTEAIYANENLSDYERQKQLNDLNTQQQKALTDYLAELQTKEQTDSILVQKEKIEKTLLELEQDKKIVENALATNVQKEIEKLNINDIIAQVSPSYFENQTAIQQNTTLSEKEKLEQLNQNDHELINRLLDETATTKEQLAQTTEKKVLQSKLQLLDNQITASKTAIAGRVKEIEKIKDQELIASKEQKTQAEIDAIAQTADDAYQKSMIELQGSLDATTNIANLEQLQKELNKQSAALTSYKKTHPNNTSIDAKLLSIENKSDEVAMLLKNEKEEFEKQQIAQQKQEELAKAEQAKQTANETNVTTEQPAPTAQQVIEKWQAAYNGNLKNDLASSPQSVEETTQTIDRLAAYRAQINQPSNEAVNNANYKKALEQENKRIDARINELKQQKSSFEQQIAQQKQEELAKAEQAKQTANETNVTTEQPAPTAQQVIEKWQAAYNGNLKNDLASSPQSVEETTQTIDRLAAYRAQINQPSNEAVNNANYKSALEQENKRIDARINELKQQKTSLEQQIALQKQEELAKAEQAKQTTNETNASNNELSQNNEVVNNQQKVENKTTNTNEQAQPTVEKVVKTPAIIVGELQKTYNGDIQADFESQSNSIDAIEENIVRLTNYRAQINHSTAKKEDKAAHQQAVEQENKRIDNRIQQLEAQIEDLQQQQIAFEKPEEVENVAEQKTIEQTSTNIDTAKTIVENPTNNEVENNNLSSIEKQDTIPTQELAIEKVEETQPTLSKIDSLTAQLNATELSKKERKAVQQQIATIQKEEAENRIVAINQSNQIYQQQIDALSETGNKNAVQLQYEQKQAALKNQLAKEKSVVGQELLLRQLLEQNQTHLAYLEQANELKENQQIAENNEGSRIYSEETLQDKKRRFTIEIGELENLRSEKQNALSAAKKSKEKAQLATEISAIDTQQQLLRQELAFIDAQLSLNQPLEKPIDLAHNNVVLTYNEERQIASSENYEHYAIKIAQQNQLVEQHAVKSEQLTQAQQQLAHIREQEISDTRSEKTTLEQEKRAIIDTIANISLSLSELETKIAHINNEANSYLPTETTEAMKFQNLVARGINPIKKSLVATALIPISANGIDYNPTTPLVATTKAIPVDVLSPKGLVYRVQVGAFAKALPEGHFKEFTPVTGEKLENSNIVRYMAGYFNNANSVVEAREKIRTFGYNDAFVVAYCDGKRIPFFEARKLEESGQCVGNNPQQIQIEVATNIAQNLGIDDTTKTLKKVPEYNYNKAPGAAKATAIEQFDQKKVYFTVQVGVFNKPASIDKLYHLNPLYTYRLGNGQIRYNVGLFDNLNAAVDSQTKIKNTVKDAFVTAYYNNERISIGKALKLIAEGTPTSSQTTIDNSNSIGEDVVEEKSVFDESYKIVRSLADAQTFVQFVSKKTYDDYPKEELNRYNAKGNFYYDKQSKHIISDYYPAEGLTPRISAFANVMDTVHLNKALYEKNRLEKVTISINQRTIPGDFNDWLIKQPYRKEFELLDEQLEIRIFDVAQDDIEVIQKMASLFGFNFSDKRNEIENEQNNE